MNDPYFNIQKNKAVFEDLKELAISTDDTTEKIRLLKFSALWAIQNHTGQFSDIEIEKALSNIADYLDCTQETTYQENSFLHVITECFETGGHTRIVEKWINASDNNEKHSLLLIQQHAKIPDWLLRAVKNKNGDLYNLTTYIVESESALELRKISSGYQFIILHINMDDVVPLLAFGTEKFKRPIIFMNHADHLFWIGVSLIDLLAECSEDSMVFTQQKRGILYHSILPVPIDEIQPSILAKKLTLEKLQLPYDKKNRYILSMASNFKFHLLDDYAFIAMAFNLIDQNQNTTFIIIGPDKAKERAWADAYTQSNGKINAIGLKKREEISLYKEICDVYIDSFPFNSYTSFLEFAILGIPSLALKTLFNSLDILKNTPNHLNSIDELLQCARHILNRPIDDTFDLSQKIRNHHIVNTSWNHFKSSLIASVPITHTLHWDFMEKEIIDEYDQNLYLLNRKKEYTITIQKKLSLKSNIRILIIYLRNQVIRPIAFIPYLLKVLRYALKRS